MRAKKGIKFSKTTLKKDILKEAKVLKLPEASVKLYAEAVSEKVSAWAMKRGAVTQNDINRETAKEIKKYSKDLAFIYENRGKII